MAGMENILRQCFDSRSPPSDSLVIEKLFSNIEVISSDAAFPVNFSDANLKYTVGRGVPLAWFWCDAIIEIVENNYKKNPNNPRDRAVKRLIECVLNFLRDDVNCQHLMKVRSAETEAEIQAILSHHLFVLLSPSAEYLIDCNHNWPVNLKKCPACNMDLKLGNTSLGNPRVWYGFPDIITDRTTVKVERDEDESTDDEETQDYEVEEPATKRLKIMQIIKPHKKEIEAGGECSALISDVYSTCVEVKKDKGFASEKNLQQIFAQTITNAFYQSKQNPKLKDLCIPSFLVSNDKLKILMYNCEQDRLYMSVNMSLWNVDGSLNVGTVICIWLALNFENFQNHVKEDDLENVSLKKSAFQTKLPDGVLSIYRDDLRRLSPIKKMRTNEPQQLTAFDLPSSRYARSVVDKLKKMADRYFT